MFRDALVGGSVDATEQLLFAAAAAGGAPEQVGRDSERMIFKKPCYFTIVLDNDDWDFYFPDPETQPVAGAEAHDPIVFIGSKTMLIETPDGPARREVATYDKNGSFYNAEEVMVGGDGTPSVRINFVRDEAGQPLLDPEATQDLGFEILVRIPFALSATENRKIVVIIDPDGQNQGSGLTDPRGYPAGFAPAGRLNFVTSGAATCMLDDMIVCRLFRFLHGAR